MTKEEYFKDWLQVIPEKELNDIITRINPIRNKICPKYKNIFKAFNLCPYRELRVIILGQDPYPQLNKATGLAFANSDDTPYNKLSPSLQVIKDSLIDLDVKSDLFTFAPSLEKWEEKGILLLNTALTCEVNNPGSHTLLWRPFICKLITNICNSNSGLIFVLFGNSAQSFEPYINKFQHIIKEKHPSYYARNKQSMPNTVWKAIESKLMDLNGYV